MQTKLIVEQVEKGKGNCYFCRNETEDRAKIDDKMEFCCESCQDEQMELCDGEW